MCATTAAGRDRAVTAEEQDAPEAIPDHRLDQRARQVERTVKNHTPDQLPIRIGSFNEWLVRPDRSIVDQYVDPAELGQRPGGQRLDLGLLADIGENRGRLDPQIPGLTRDGLSLLLSGARVDHDMRPFAGQPQHSRTADIAPRSGDQCDLAFELAHAPITPTIFASDSACAVQCFRTAHWPLSSKRTVCRAGAGTAVRLNAAKSACCLRRHEPAARAASRAVNAHTASYRLSPVIRRRP